MKKLLSNRHASHRSTAAPRSTSPGIPRRCSSLCSVLFARPGPGISSRVHEPPLSSRAGFTLIEIMVVVFILGLLVALVAPQVIGQGERAKREAATIQLKQFEEAVALFKLQTGRYPTNSEGLNALVPPGPPDVKDFDPDGYMKEIPLDPWKNPYVYRADGRRFTITSYGADGQPGGEARAADIEVSS